MDSSSLRGLSAHLLGWMGAGMVGLFLFICLFRFLSLFSCHPEGGSHQHLGKCFDLSSSWENTKIRGWCNAQEGHVTGISLFKSFLICVGFFKCNIIFTHFKASLAPRGLFGRSLPCLHFDKKIAPPGTADFLLPVMGTGLFKVHSPNSALLSFGGDFGFNSYVVHLSQTFVLTLAPACFTFLSLERTNPE